MLLLHRQTVLNIVVSSPCQMSQKQQEVQQLNQDLLEQRAEIAALRSSLESKELVKSTLQPFSNSASAAFKWPFFFT